MKPTLLAITLAVAGSTALAAPPAQVVKVTLTDSTVTLDAATVKPGKVTFEISSGDGSKNEHELVVLRTDLDPAKLPVKGGKVEEDKVKNVGEVEGVKPGKVKKLTLNLKPGAYSVICNMPGHYGMGMHTALTVAN